MPKLTRLLFSLFLAFAPILAFTPTAQAEPLQGLGVDVYTFDSSALPERQVYTLCGGDSWVFVPNIDADWGGGVVAGCQEDFVLIHYSGFLISPKSGDITFRSWADDGFSFSLDGVAVIDDWTLKGCGGSSATFTMVANQPYEFDAWWYEYGGGACNRLFWDAEGEGMNIISPNAFSSEPLIVEPPVVPTPEPTLPPVVPVDPEPPIVPVDPVDPPVKPPVVKPEPPVVVPPVVEPPVVEPPVVKPEPPVVKPEPSIVDVPLTEIDPQSLSSEDVALLTEDALRTFETAVEGSEEYNLALTQLMVVAQADDIVVPEEIASIPVLGATIVGLTNAFNALGNFGADMSPKVRDKAKKEVVAAVVVTQIASAAVGLTASAPTSIRRIK
jgi:hypothetical protein